MTIKLYPQHYDVDSIATCGDCGNTCKAIECGPISDPSERLSSGDHLPAGECPNCGSLSYVADRWASKFIIETLIGQRCDDDRANDWENLVRLDGTVEVEGVEFASYTEANEELEDHFENMRNAAMDYDRADYRIRELRQHTAEHAISILWGEHPEPNDKPIEYIFNTKAELQAFIDGIEACDGWMDYEVVS